MRTTIGAILIVWLFLGGCVSHVGIDIKPVLERRPLLALLPLTVGVYFTPEFRAYRSSKCGNVPGGTLCREYNLGPQSVGSVLAS